MKFVSLLALSLTSLILTPSLFAGEVDNASMDGDISQEQKLPEETPTKDVSEKMRLGANAKTSNPNSPKPEAGSLGNSSVPKETASEASSAETPTSESAPVKKEEPEVEEFGVKTISNAASSAPTNNTAPKTQNPSDAAKDSNEVNAASEVKAEATQTAKPAVKAVVPQTKPVAVPAKNPAKVAAPVAPVSNPAVAPTAPAPTAVAPAAVQKVQPAPTVKAVPATPVAKPQALLPPEAPQATNELAPAKAPTPAEAPAKLAPKPIAPVASPAAPLDASDVLPQASPTTAPKKALKPADVGLTAQQSQSILAIRKASNMEYEKKLTEELKQAKADMNSAMIDATPTEEVKKKFEVVQKKTLELQRLKFERTLKIRDVLTVEQRKKLNTGKPTH